MYYVLLFFFSSRRRHTRWPRDWSSDVCSSDLFVVSCSFSFYRVRFGDLKALRHIAPENRPLFRIDEDGSYIHWPDEDIHMDIDTLEYYTNEEYRKKADILKLQYLSQFWLFRSNGATCFGAYSATFHE